MNTPLRLSELTEIIQSALVTQLDTSFWVTAEVSSLSVKGGHAYFDLIEKSPTGLLSAKLRATCWANTWGMLHLFFEQETGSAIQPGMTLLVEVEVDFHAVYGLSVNIVSIDPTYTVGDLARQRQETINRLDAEGLLTLNHALILPTITKRIAVISAADAAGYEDFCHQLKESGFCFNTTLYSAIMQGERAAAAIIAALDAIVSQWEDFDAVVIIRGGGATTDLTAFDDYALCAHAAQSPLPLITGIGHTKDVSVLDLVAHTALKTPTAVASFLVDARMAEWNRVVELRRRLRQTAERQILIRRHRLELLGQSLQMLSPARIFERGYSLTLCNGHVLRDADSVQSGDEITVHLHHGSLRFTR